ncbi:AAA family ATPase [Thermoleophilia bacterium SCSIO 60948]|nr:AAA family ATPase [Thermoleophilia bacterium SCSIO 60948]
MAGAVGTSRLVERGDDLARLERLVEAAAGGDGRTLTILGPAGIGKSRLLDELRGLAAERGFEVLSARGGELESGFAHGVVRQLLERRVALADPERRGALLAGAAGLARPALGLPAGEEDAGVDATFAAVHGLYWLVANLATDGPLLIAVDDVQWADAASLRFLLYLAGRLDGLPVLICMTERTSEGLDATSLTARLRGEADERVEPRALSPEGSATLLAERLGTEIQEPFAAACREATGGNPFLLAELAAALRSDGIEPTAENSGQVGVLGPESVAHSLLLRIGRRAPECMRAVEAAAVLGPDTEPEVIAALSGLDMPRAMSALNELTAIRVLAPERPVRFEHPILRAAILSDLSADRRIELHRAAASELSRRGAESGALAIHLLATDPRGDERVVAALREAARGALREGAVDEAVGYLRRALAEPPEAGSLADVQFEFGAAEWLRGERVEEAMSALRAAVEASASAELRAERVRVLARALFNSGAVADAFELLDAEVDALEREPIEREALTRLKAEHGSIGMLHPPTATRAVARLRAETPTDDRERSPADLLMLCNLAASMWQEGTASEVSALARRALAGGRLLASEGCDSFPVHQAVWILAYADDLEPADETLELAVEDARRRGSVFGFAMASGLRALVAWRRGQVRVAEAEARAGIDAGPVSPFVRPAIYGYLAFALLERGALDEAEEAIELSGCGPGLPPLIHFNPVFFARGELRFAQGRMTEALEDFAELGRRDAMLGMRNPGIPWRCGAASAHSRLGEGEAALALAREHLELAERWGTASARGEARRALGLARGEAGLADLEAAIELLRGSPARLELARGLNDLGAALRRSGSRREAREPLRESVDIARDLGATLLAERAHEELRLAGAKPRRLMFSGLESLTASERRVADAAAAGHTNREIAEALFVTPKTVENHLGRVYSKLGITSRAELAPALTSD